MTKNRNISDLLDATGDIKSTALDNVPPSDNASALTTGTLDNARLPSNIADTGTEGTKIASGTTAQRGSTAGQFRFNTTTGFFEGFDGTVFKALDTPPTVSSIDVTEVDSQAGGNQTIVITGSGFNSGATVTFVGNAGTNFNASTVTVDSATQITAVAPKASFLNAQEPYGVKVTNLSGLSTTLASQINVDTSPSWQTASGNLGTIEEGSSANFTVSATDPDGDTVAYSETTSVLSGAGFSLNSSTGAITGTASSVSADTTNTFTLRATANGKTADRSFNIITSDNPYIGADGLFGFNNNYTNNGTGTYTTGVSGTGVTSSATFVTSPKKFGTHSVKLDGFNDHLDVTTNNNIKTIAFWLYWEGYAYSRSYIVDGRKDGNNKGYWTWDSNNTSAVSIDGITETAFSWSPSTNTWYHCAITLGSTSYIYINGTQKLSSTDSNNFIDTTGFVIGTYFNVRGSAGGNYWLDGHIDNLALFPTQFSSSQITNLYNATKDM